MKPTTAALLALLLAGPTPAEATRLLPSWAEYHGVRETALAWRALAEDRLDDASAHAFEASNLLPDRTDSWLVAARAAIGQARWDDARAAVEALRRIDSEHVDGLELLGRVAIEQGDADAARQAFEALRGMHPALPAPLLGLALVEARLGDRDAAIRHLAAARELDPTLELAGLLLEPGWADLRDDETFVEALNGLLRE